MFKSSCSNLHCTEYCLDGSAMSGEQIDPCGAQHVAQKSFQKRERNPVKSFERNKPLQKAECAGESSN